MVPELPMASDPSSREVDGLKLEVIIQQGMIGNTTLAMRSTILLSAVTNPWTWWNPLAVQSGLSCKLGEDQVITSVLESTFCTI